MLVRSLAAVLHASERPRAACVEPSSVIPGPEQPLALRLPPHLTSSGGFRISRAPQADVSSSIFVIEDLCSFLYSRLDLRHSVSADNVLNKEIIM